MSNSTSYCLVSLLSIKIFPLNLLEGLIIWRKKSEGYVYKSRSFDFMPLSGACALPPYLGLENLDIVKITNHPWEVTNGVVTRSTYRGRKNPVMYPFIGSFTRVMTPFIMILRTPSSCSYRQLETFFFWCRGVLCLAPVLSLVFVHLAFCRCIFCFRKFNCALWCRLDLSLHPKMPVVKKGFIGIPYKKNVSCHTGGWRKITSWVGGGDGSKI